MFFAKRGVRLLNRLLSVIFISRFGQVLVYLLVGSNERTVYSFFYQVFTPVYYLAPACFYLYVTAFINGRSQLRKFEWFHFIPFFLAIVHILPWPISPPVNWSAIADQILENKQLFITERSGLFPSWFYYVGRPILLLAYLTATWVAILKSKFIQEKVGADGKKWILFFVRAATFFQLTSFVPLLIWDLEGSLFNALFIMLNCVVLLVIVVFIMHQPKLFYGYLFVAVDMEEDKEEVEEEVKEFPKTEAPAKKVNLMSDQVSVYADLMKSFMESKRPYLQANFQIVDLANEINIPVHHCSFVINKFLEKNFRDWINGYRIDFFIIQYPLKSDKMTIEAIAYESGFKSLATFYNAFKKETGLMPKAFFLTKKVS
ncbi:helix-turn-helix domain-containing protein [Pedobacter nyackensis]|uniref:helix-turn-helix domain-containing protein n=1 Tax=Pedobacter nyackensis TaxID=475255 RepID=UPI00292F11DE|nr:helix-turn-helix domain-containing protein [Pedobacter nyackensis]